MTATTQIFAFSGFEEEREKVATGGYKMGSPRFEKAFSRENPPLKSSKLLKSIRGSWSSWYENGTNE